MSDLEGKQIKHYQFLKVIGSGGFGTIYYAYQNVIKREVAIKVINEKYAGQPHFIKRFEEEARTIARLEHPGIVPLYDYWREPKGAYLVMRWLGGGSLRERMLGSHLDLTTISKCLNSISSALSLAHSNHIIHRDVKPENIMLDEWGSFYLTDFGIAIDTLSYESEIESYGTPGYMSPEQLLENRVSMRADIYSLGIVLYELLTNELPFEGSNTQETIHMQVRQPIPIHKLKLLRPELPVEVSDIIQRATAFNPNDRYDSAIQLARDFQQAIASLPAFKLSSSFNSKDNKTFEKTQLSTADLSNDASDDEGYE